MKSYLTETNKIIGARVAFLSAIEYEVLYKVSIGKRHAQFCKNISRNNLQVFLHACFRALNETLENIDILNEK